MNDLYRKYIEGKRIIFVGASTNLVGLKKGGFIDGFDIVVKSGGSIYLTTPEYYRDYGKRIDVLCVNVQFCREMRPIPVAKFRDKGVKWLCMKSPSRDDLDLYGQYINARSMRTSLKEVQEHVKSASMGLAIFKDILNCNPKEFFLTGIDFFSSKKKTFEHDNYQEYLNGYLPDVIRKQGNIINKGKSEDGHNFLENAKYIYKLFQENKNLKTEKFIYNLLKNIIERKEVQK